MIASNNFHYNEIVMWKEIKKTALNMDDGLAKDGAVKELNNKIIACKNEDIFRFIDDKVMSDILEIIYNSWLEHEDVYFSEIFKSAMNCTCFDEENTLNSIASFNPYEIIGYEIIMQILNTNIMIQKLEAGRFVQNAKDKNNRVSILEKSLKIAHNYNNTSLVHDLQEMISKIDNEDYISKEVIIKNCFYNIHKLLSTNSSYFNGVKPLAKETYAKDIANAILNDFFNVERNYKPSKNIAKKEFYEQNETIPRTLYYYLSK